MAKRLLSMAASEQAALDKKALLEAIAASEGRILAAETIGTHTALLGDVSNAEFAAAMGADLLLLNMLDIQNPQIAALPACAPETRIQLLRRLTGRLIGMNLEPVEAEAVSAANQQDALWTMREGRRATVENARLACERGVSFLAITGNPGNQVSNAGIVRALREISEAVGERLVLMAGKMHASGVLAESGERIVTRKDIMEFIQAGADVIMLPAPGTVPGLTTGYIREQINLIHSLGKLAMTCIGTSQEGADKETIRRIALECKMAGADIHHLGDSGYLGMSLPENIMAYSVTIRGIRHTYRRMAMSVLR